MTEARSHFDFLGYRFYRTKKGKLTRYPSPKSEKRLREKLRKPTRRTNAHGMKEIIRRCNKAQSSLFGAVDRDTALGV